MEMFRILVADDDPSIPKLFQNLLGRSGFQIDAAFDGEEALSRLKTARYELAFVDMKMPKLDGLSLLREIKKFGPEVDIVIITGYASIEGAVEAIKMGASDYLPKPFRFAQVKMIIEKLRKVKELREQNRYLKDQLRERFRIENLIGSTPQMQAINQFIQRLRDEDCNILITGESGTGKELVARALHYEGKRKNELFVPIDCGAIHKNLLESELFGHEKGAFTGAYARKIGLFEKANKGTAFLDEIGEIPLELQSTLLRVIEEKKIRPVGSTENIDVDVRIISASNKDLEEMVKRGLFRRDLFFRINIVSINIPPLRERKDDIPQLVDFFLKKYSRIEGKPLKRIKKETLEVLMHYDWPGNVRELENLIERAYMLSTSAEITMEDLPHTILHSIGYARGISSKTIQEIELEAIKKALASCGGDTLSAARMLGIDRSTIYRKLKKLGIRPRQLRI